MAVLAGLLIIIGVRLVKVADFTTARVTGDLAIYAVTLLTVVFVNLLAGVVTGLALAMAAVLWRVVRAGIHAEPLGARDDQGAGGWSLTAPAASWRCPGSATCWPPCRQDRT